MKLNGSSTPVSRKFGNSGNLNPKRSGMHKSKKNSPLFPEGNFFALKAVCLRNNPFEQTKGRRTTTYQIENKWATTICEDVCCILLKNHSDDKQRQKTCHQNERRERRNSSFDFNYIEWQHICQTNIAFSNAEIHPFLYNKGMGGNDNYG